MTTPPPLPGHDGYMAHDHGIKAWSEADMRNYGAACAAAQRERDAAICDGYASIEGIAQQCTEAIRGQEQK